MTRLFVFKTLGSLVILSKAIFTKRLKEEARKENIGYWVDIYIRKSQMKNAASWQNPNTTNGADWY